MYLWTTIFYLSIIGVIGGIRGFFKSNSPTDVLCSVEIILFFLVLFVISIVKERKQKKSKEKVKV